MTDSFDLDLAQGAALTSHDDGFRENPHPRYDALRRQPAPVRDAAYGRILLTRYDDVRAALRHKAFSVDARRTHHDSYMRRVAGTGVSESVGNTAYEPPLVLLDDPDHRRIRSLVSKVFNPRSVEQMRDRVEAITGSLLDAMEGREALDFIRDFAAPLPTQVILDMLGMSASSRDDFKRWSEDILWGYDPERGPAVQKRLREAYLGMSAEFREVVAKRRKAPEDDLISAMVSAQEHDAQLTDLQIISLCTQLMVAGNVTTTDLIGNGMHALLNHPEQLKRLRQQPDLTGTAIEEMLRYDCPITETARIPVEDGHLNGCPVHAGDTLTASIAAANHDPARFVDPHIFDIERANNDHLGFGSGPHVCLGAPLARLEAQIAIRAFISRFPKVQLDEKRLPAHRHLPFFRGFTALPVNVKG